MNAFRYQAIEQTGASVQGVIEAEDRKAALRLLGQRGLFPSNLEICGSNGATTAASGNANGKSAMVGRGRRVGRKDVSAFTRELSALVSAGIPIPQALDSLGEENENAAFRDVVLQIADSVKKGVALSAALEEHPKLFGKLYASMVRVGEEAGQLPVVMADLANLMEHEDEVRGEVKAAVAYPIFVLCFGFITVTVLLTVVLPRLFTMLQEILPVLPLPTLILLRASNVLHRDWLVILVVIVAVAVPVWKYLEHAERRGDVGQGEIAIARGGLDFSRRGAGAICAHARDAGEGRSIAFAGIEDCGEHNRQSCAGGADRTRGGGDAGRGFAGGAVAEAGDFSTNGGADD